MPGIAIVAVLEAHSIQHSLEKIRRQNLRDTSDPLAYPNAVFISHYRLNNLNEYLNWDRNSWLLGDSGYGLEPFLMTPYKDATAGTIEHQFNKRQTLGRNIVERTIGVIKSRFRCLLGTLVYSHQKVTIINMCVALHNICREFNVDCEADIAYNADNGDDEIFDEVEEFSQRNMYNIAKRLRDNIAAGLD